MKSPTAKQKTLLARYLKLSRAYDRYVIHRSALSSSIGLIDRIVAQIETADALPKEADVVSRLTHRKAENVRRMPGARYAVEFFGALKGHTLNELRKGWDI
jgi:hypothetical protein